jgi:hypothetical protein
MGNDPLTLNFKLLWDASAFYKEDAIPLIIDGKEIKPKTVRIKGFLKLLIINGYKVKTNMFEITIIDGYGRETKIPYRSLQ